METEDLLDNEFDENSEEEEKRNICFVICIILILVMMFPSTIALLAIF